MPYNEDAAARRWRPGPKHRKGPRESTSARGYGYQHRKLREQWRPHVEAGTVDCHAVVCRMPARRLRPGEAWDLGHNVQRTAWTGPEHTHCNRHEGAARKVARLRMARVTATSREW